eukprot:8687427-Pyramimonas_sp.AAC.1
MLSALAYGVRFGKFATLGGSADDNQWGSLFRQLHGWASARLRAGYSAFQFAVCLRQFCISSDAVLCNLVETDRVNFLNARADELNISLGHRQSTQEWQRVKTLLKCGGRGDRPKQGPPQLPMIKKPDGAVLLEDSEVSEHIQEHFAKVESGRSVDVDHLTREYNTAPPLLEHSAPRDPLVVPALYETEQLLGRLKSGRVPGTDFFRGDFGGAAPRALARLITPVLVKTYVLAREPISFKGGRLGHFWKGSGDPTLAATKRSILVAAG